MAASIQSPEKELRFTRAGQATIFWIGAAVMTSVAVTLLATAIYRDENPRIPHGGWAVLPLGVAMWLGHTAVHLTRHAYLILTPLGIEIFPFFRPAAGMRLITWQEISAAETDDRFSRLTLHHDAEKTSGVHLSLSPIRADRRSLLAKAVIGRVSPPGSNG